MSKPTIEELKKIHNDLREYYDVRDYTGAKLYIENLHKVTRDVNRLRTVLVISKSFKNHEVLEDTLRKTVELIEEQGIKVV
jgi:RNAse (barnase) inhibitor barstar